MSDAKNYIRDNKLFIYLSAITAIGMLVGGFLVRVAYNWGIIEYISNNILHFSYKTQVHYTNLAYTLFFELTAGMFLLTLLYRLIVSIRPVSIIWPVLLAIYVLTTVYILNPNNRIYSFHGFFHAGIIYQIINGNIPPFHPLLACETLYYPWGYHLVSARLCQTLNITPFTSAAILNILAMVLIMLITYKIASVLVKSKKARILAMLFVLFGGIIFNRWFPLPEISKLHISMQYLKYPVGTKFFNFNAMPVGLIFFLGFLYSITRIYTGRRVCFDAFILFGCYLGCGFLYPEILPGILAGTVGAIVAGLILSKSKGHEQVRDFAFRSMIAVAVMAAAITLFLPYLYHISAGGRHLIHYFLWQDALRKLLASLFLAVPILLVIIINIRALKEQINNYAMMLLSGIAAACYLTYLLVNLPHGAEYKYMYMTMIILTIVGAISLGYMKRWARHSLVFILAMIFLLPAVGLVKHELSKLQNIPITYYETGMVLHSKDAQKDSLYSWIRNNTPANSVVIDTELDIPVYSQRQLFVGIDKFSGTKRIGQLGYFYSMEKLLCEMSGYDKELLKQRTMLVDDLYENGSQKDALLIKSRLRKLINIYVITRTKKEAEVLDHNSENFDRLFESENGQYRVYIINL